MYLNGTDTGLSTAVTAAASGSISIASLDLQLDDKIFLTSSDAGTPCVLESAIITVTSKSLEPVVTGDYCISGILPQVTGTSSEIGATITVYSKAGSGVTTSDTNEGTATVLANGSWSLSGLTIASGRYIAATAKNGSKLVSDISNEVQILTQTAIGSLAITSSPITEGDVSISGTSGFADGTVIQLYLDGDIIDGSTTTISSGDGSWTISALDAATNPGGFDILYTGAPVTVTATETGGACESVQSSSVTVMCEPPVAFTVSSLSSTTVCENSTLSLTIDDTETGVIYQVFDQSGNSIGPSKLGTGASMSISTDGIASTVTTLEVRASKIGVTCTIITSTNTLGPITLNSQPSITLGANPSAVFSAGAQTVDLTYSATTGTSLEYKIDYDNVAFTDIAYTTLTASPLSLSVPAGLVAGSYSATFTIKEGVNSCEKSYPITITITDASTPTITLTDTTAEACLGDASVDFTYSGTTNIPDQYSINFDADAEAVGFRDVTDQTLPVSPIPVIVSSIATAGTYNAVLIVKNSGTGKLSIEYPFTITIPDGGTIGSDQSISSGDNVAAFTETAAPVGHVNAISYKWQKSTTSASTGFADIGGVTSTTFDEGTITQTTYYKRVATSLINGASCSVESNVITVTVTAALTTSAAGSDINQCNTSSFTLAGNTPGAGNTGSWSVVSGTATITTPSSPTSGVTGVPSGTSATLRWTITNGVTSSTDDVVLTNDAAATVSAAGSDIVQISNSSFALAGNTAIVGTGMWSVVSGTATITTPGSTTSGVTGVPVGTSATLRWTITNGTCSSTDDVVLTNNAAQSDLSITKTASTGTPNVGSNVTFTLTVTNNGPSASTGFTVQDVLPGGYTYVSDTGGGTTSESSGTITWTNAALANGANTSIDIVATVNTTGSYANTATITASNETDSTPGNDSDTNTPIPVPQSDLSIAKTVSNSTPNIGDNVTFTLTINNAGPSTATGVVVNDLLPSGYTYVSDNGGGSYVSGTGIWTVGSLTNGGNTALAIVATVNATGSYANTASITGDQIDPDPTDDTDTNTPVPLPQSDLSIAKTVSNSAPNVGDNVTFTLTINNAGPSATTGVVVNDLLPSGYTYVSDTPSTGSYVSGTGVWTVGSLANAASATLQIVATVNATGSYANTATVTGDQNDPDPTDDTDTNTPVPVPQSDLSIVKTVSAPAPLIGDDITFTLTINNAGPSAATGVVVNDLLPSGYTYVNDTPSKGSYVSGTGVWTVGSLANGASATLQIIVTVNATGSYANTASITGDQNDPDPTDDTDTNTPVPGAPQADLSITKIVDDATPNVGDNITFTLTVTNSGPSAATGVVVNDLLPSGYTYVSDTPSVGSYVSGTGVWTVGSLTNAASATLQIVATVNATGSYANTATVSGNEIDPDPTDDSDTNTPSPICVDPNPPAIGNVTQPTCIITTGSVELSGLPSTGTWTVTESVGNTTISGTGTTATFSGLSVGNYTFTVENAVGCISVDSNNIILLVPVPPSDPIAIDQEFCGPATIADLTATIPAGSELIWYAASTGGSSLTTSTSLSSTTYYAVSRDLTTGCESARMTVGVTIKDIPTFGLGTVSQVTTCAGSDGSIELSGLKISTLYQLSYLRDGIAVNTTTTTDGSGNISIASLPSGSYSNFQVTLDGCDSTVLAGPVVISEPIPAVITLDTNTDPTTCSGTDGAITIGGLTSSISYSVSYLQDGAPIVTNLVANGSGQVIISGLPAGSYTNIAVESSSCQSNTLAGVVLSDPTTPTIALDVVNHPLTCAGKGSIEFTGLVASTNYTFNYTYNGVASTTTVSSDGAGRLIVTNLDAGLYENMTVIFAGCVSNTIARAVLNPPTISLGAVSDPAQCTTLGNFEILGLVINELYTVNYLFNGTPVSVPISSNASGSIIVPNLAAGTYTNIQVTDQNSCVSNTIASVDISLPTAPIVALGTVTSPDGCLVANGSIQLTGLDTNATYTVNYDVDGNATSTNVSTDGTGNIILTSLSSGSYTDITVTSITTLCESNVLSTSLTLPSPPVVPTVTDQTFCGPVTVADLVGTADLGQVVTWYDQAVGGTALSTGTSLASGIYYASSFDLTTGCESARVAVTITVNACSDLSIIKTVSNSTPNVGEEITFTIFVKNNGPDIATGVDIEDILPIGYQNINSISNSGTATNNVIGWNNLTIPLTGMNLTYNVSVALPTGAVDEYKNVIQIMASDTVDLDSDPNNDDGDQSEDDEDSSIVIPQTADLSLAKSASDPNPNVGDIVTFSLVLTNDGPSTATNVSIQDMLPLGFTYVANSVSNNGVYDVATETLDWGGINIQSNTSLTFTYQVIINEPSAVPIPNDEYRNTAQITASDQYDPDSSENNDDGDQSEDDEAQASITPQIADLSLSKIVNSTNANVGDIVTFSLALTNDGPSDATHVFVTDNLPVGFEYVSHSGGNYTLSTGIWDVGTIVNGQTITLTIDVRVLPPTGTNDEYNNVAEVTGSDQFDPDSDSGNGGGLGEDDDDSSSITIASLDLSLLKTVDNLTPIVNDNVTFTITLQNNSMVTATNIEIDESLPSGYEYVSHIASMGTYDSFSGNWQLSSLNGNTSATLAIVVKVKESGEYLNTVSITSVDQTDTNSTNDSSSSSTTPLCLTIYNEFSPNGDGTNDFFVIDCIGNYPNNVLEVFNRWGNTVFKKKNYDNSWDGTSTGRATVSVGEKLPVGTYYYVLDLGDGSKPKTGWIYINR